ncbi:hypothetical protein [Devosia sp.]|uniref:hypothetical protein n=1 Tax=Devosia sp. TaxID=1871048 RepID=UPI001B1CE4BA|nr:hypothetical protein [Devosia sp.]MBO9590919.1 hypothetical protein [Devosia sp.]
MPMSRFRYTLNEAVGDPSAWTFTWAIADDVTLASSCGFCGQEHQRLTYEVARGDVTLWICQRCVGRYPVSGVIDGDRFDLPSVRAYIHGLTARQKQRTCQEAIRKVQTALPDLPLGEIVVYFERNLQLSPQHAAALFAGMAQLDEPIDPRIFEVQTRSIAHQDEFGTLDERARAVVWPALTPQQRRRLASLGFAPGGARTRRARPSDRRELPAPRMPALSEPAMLDPLPEPTEKSTA